MRVELNSESRLQNARDLMAGWRGSRFAALRKAVSLLAFAAWSIAQPAHAGFITRLFYFEMSGALVANLTGDPRFPDQFDAFENLNNEFRGSAAVASNYGSYIRGWIEAPQTGAYTFWIASADQSELWLSSSEDPAGKSRIAYEPVTSVLND